MDSLFAAFPSPAPLVHYRPRLPSRLLSPRGYRTVWTLTGPMHHGADQKAGNVNLFRRHTVPDPLTGLTHEVPFVSGNAIRGNLRDRGMGLHLQLLGLRARDILPERAHALLAGGAVEKGADGATVNNVVRSRARELCPPWDLFAGCIDQQIMQGRGRVSDATLVCRETAWKTRGVVAPELHLEEFAAQLPSCDEMLAVRQLVRHKHADVAESEGIQMLAQFEILREGQQMIHGIQLWALDGVEPTTASFLAYLLDDFRVLGWAGAGFARDFGAIAFDSYAPADGALALPSTDIYLEYVNERKQEMIDWLTMPAAPTSSPARSRSRSRGRTASDAEAAE